MAPRAAPGRLAARVAHHAGSAPARWCSPGIPQRPGFLLVKRVAWREERRGWWLASDNPAAGAVDSARFGPVPAEKIVARGAGPLLAVRAAGRGPE